MAGIVSDIQQICSWINYLKDVHDSIEGNREKCQMLSTRCQSFETYLQSLSNNQDCVNSGVKVLYSAIGKCVNFVKKYSLNSWKRKLLKLTFPKEIEKEFIDLNAALTQAANDLQFGIIVSSSAINNAANNDRKRTSDIVRRALKDCGIIADEMMELEALVDKYSDILDSNRNLFEDRSNLCPSMINFATVDLTQLQYSQVLLGKGQFSTVYEGYCENGKCAIKCYDVDRLSDNELQSVKREVYFMQICRHRNIIAFIGFNLEKGVLLCELALGSLDQVLYKINVEAHNTVVSGEILKLKWILDISVALRYLHFQGITHGDIKPQRILLVSDSDGIVAKVSGFGFSSSSRMASLGLLQPLEDSVKYRAPEIVDTPIDSSTVLNSIDIYSLGILVNEIMCEAIPWSNCSSSAEIQAKVKQGLRPQRFSADHDIAKQLICIVGSAAQGCLAENPSTRPSAVNIVDDLQKIVGSISFCSTVTMEMEQLKYRANSGDSQSQILLGLIFLTGCGVHRTRNHLILNAYDQIVTRFHLDIKPFCININVEPDSKKALSYFMMAAVSSSVGQCLVLRTCCHQGHADGQYNLGWCYLVGDGVSIDTHSAFVNFKLSADQGHITSQFKVGWCYDKGIGVAVDKEKAFQYYKMSADKGHTASMFLVGRRYQTGEGVTKNKGYSFTYYLKCAKEGHMIGQYNVGLCFENGVGVEVDKEEAFNFFLQAARQGYANAQYRVGNCLHFGSGVSENIELAFQYYRLSAEQDHTDAQYRLALCFDKGEGTAVDHNEALKWYLLSAKKSIHKIKASADEGHADSQFIFGFYCANGEGVLKNYEDAFAYFKLAADQDHVQGQYAVGCCYYDGNGTAVNKERAFEYFVRAAAQGSREGLYAVGRSLFNGEGCSEDKVRGFQHYLESANLGSADGQYAVGSCYSSGEGVEFDAAEAFRYYMMSAEQGNRCGQIAVSYCYRLGEGVQVDDDLSQKYYLLSINSN